MPSALVHLQQRGLTTYQKPPQGWVANWGKSPQIKAKSVFFLPWKTCAQVLPSGMPPPAILPCDSLPSHPIPLRLKNHTLSRLISVTFLLILRLGIPKPVGRPPLKCPFPTSLEREGPPC